MDPSDAHSHLALAKLEARRYPNAPDRACTAFQRGLEACPNSVHILQAWAVHEQSLDHNDKAKFRELENSLLKLTETWSHQIFNKCCIIYITCIIFFIYIFKFIYVYIISVNIYIYIYVYICVAILYLQ